MSELTQTTAAPAAETATIESTIQTTQISDTAPSESTTSEPSKYDHIPAKFLKEDGTPDYDRLAKSYTGLEKKLGTKPNIPAVSVDEYEYDFGELQVDADRTSEFKTKALEKGFTKDQFTFVMDSHKAVIDAMVWDADRTEAVLKEAWGKDYSTQTAAAKAGFDEFASSDADPNDPVWNHPAVMKLLARVGAEVGEDSLTGKVKPSKSESFEDQIAALRADPNYFSDPAIQAKAKALYEKKYK